MIHFCSTTPELTLCECLFLLTSLFWYTLRPMLSFFCVASFCVASLWTLFAHIRLRRWVLSLSLSHMSTNDWRWVLVLSRSDTFSLTFSYSLWCRAHKRLMMDFLYSPSHPFSLSRCLAVSLSRCLALSLSRSLACSLSRSLACSLSCSLALSLFRSLALSLFVSSHRCTDDVFSVSGSLSHTHTLSLTLIRILSLCHSLWLLRSLALALSLFVSTIRVVRRCVGRWKMKLFGMMWSGGMKRGRVSANDSVRACACMCLCACVYIYIYIFIHIILPNLTHVQHSVSLRARARFKSVNATRKREMMMIAFIITPGEIM